MTKWKPALWFCIAIGLISISSDIAVAREMYAFRGMWPLLKRDWYFIHPHDAAVDMDGYIYIAESNANRIQKFTRDGHLVKKWDKYGYGAGEFDYPKGITVDEQDVVYVADSGHERIQTFDSNGKFLGFFGGNLITNSIDDLASDWNGSIFTKAIDIVQQFDLEGQLIDEWIPLGFADGELYHPLDLIIRANGDMVIMDSWHRSDRIQEFNGEGEFLGKLTIKEGEKSGIAQDSLGNLLIAYRWWHMIQKIGPNGKLLMELSHDHPGGIAIDRNDNIYLTSSANNTLTKYDPSGEALGAWGRYGNGEAELNNPTRLAIDSENNIYVVDKGNYRIQKFDPSGAFLDMWGYMGSDPGGFGEIRDIAVGEASVYVADNYSRIQQFSLDGNFIRQWGNISDKEPVLRNVQGIAVGANGSLFVIDSDLEMAFENRILSFYGQW